MVIFAPYLPLELQGEWMFWLAGFGPWYFFDIIQISNRAQFEKDGFKSIVDLTAAPELSKIVSPPTPAGGGWTLTTSFISILFTTVGISGQVISSYFPSEIGNQIGTYTTYAGVAGVGLSILGAGVASRFSSSAQVAPMPMNGGGAQLPPLSTFIDKIPPPQDGGARSSAGPLFLYGLGFVAVSGLALGLIRK